jgi:hypothetical protein
MLGGVCLMTAVHAALAGAPTVWLLVLLSGAGIVHVVHLRRRWPPR